MLMKLDPIWVYFSISNHNLILNSYGDTQVKVNCACIFVHVFMHVDLHSQNYMHKSSLG